MPPGPAGTPIRRSCRPHQVLERLPTSAPWPGTRSGRRSSTRRPRRTRSAGSSSRSSPARLPSRRRGRGTRRKRRPRNRGPEGAGLLDAQGQHPAGDRPRHGRGGAAGEIERAVYEGYGLAAPRSSSRPHRQPQPHGADVRHAFDKHGGSLGEPGSVVDLRDPRRRPRRRRSVLGGRHDAGDRRGRRGRERGRRSAQAWFRRPGTCPPSARRSSRPGSIESSELTMEPRSTVEVGEGTPGR